MFAKIIFNQLNWRKTKTLRFKTVYQKNEFQNALFSDDIIETISTSEFILLFYECVQKKKCTCNNKITMEHVIIFPLKIQYLKFLARYKNNKSGSNVFIK